VALFCGDVCCLPWSTSFLRCLPIPVCPNRCDRAWGGLRQVGAPVLSENAITPSSRDSAMDRLSRLPSTRCEGSGHVGSCGPSSISLSSSRFGCSYCPFAPNGPTGSNCSLSATKSQYFDARWDDPPTGPPIVRCWPP
jgi:hypothetical protein